MTFKNTCFSFIECNNFVDTMSRRVDVDWPALFSDSLTCSVSSSLSQNDLQLVAVVAICWRCEVTWSLCMMSECSVFDSAWWTAGLSMGKNRAIWSQYGGYDSIYFYILQYCKQSDILFPRPVFLCLHHKYVLPSSCLSWQDTLYMTHCEFSHT